MSDDPKYDLMLKRGKVIDPKNNRNQRIDLAIKDGKIASVEPEIEAREADQVVDVSGLYITPGLIDIHFKRTVIDLAKMAVCRVLISTIKIL